MQGEGEKGGEKADGGERGGWSLGFWFSGVEAGLAFVSWAGGMLKITYLVLGGGGG